MAFQERTFANVLTLIKGTRENRDLIRAESTARGQKVRVAELMACACARDNAKVPRVKRNPRNWRQPLRRVRIRKCYAKCNSNIALRGIALN